MRRLEIRWRKHGNGLLAYWILVFVLGCGASQAWGGKMLCLVTSVPDGDTFRCQSAGNTYKIRIAGIDAPEKGQPFGKEAAKRLRQLVLGEEVVVDSESTDKFGRVVARVQKNGQDVGQTLVEEGCAWAYREFLRGPYASEYLKAEESARNNKLGLWRQSNPTPPWEWRQQKKQSPQTWLNPMIFRYLF